MKDKERLSQLTIASDAKISQALQQMDRIRRKLLIVLEKGRFKSLLSIGDIQRAIINGVDLSQAIVNILRTEISIAQENDSEEAIKQRMLVGRSEYMPVISEQGELVRVVFWEDLFGTDKKIAKGKLGIPVLLMAGGMGSRLRPLTNVLPKALIPIGEKSIIEQIIDSFVDYDCRDFFISVNYKADMIKYYLEGIENRGYNVSYVEEEEFLGTAGSIRLVEDRIHSTFFVSNCDIMVNEDYAAILDYHRQSKNEITMVAAMMNYKIPYGVLETNCDGLLTDINEKPEYFYKINSGLYIMEPSAIKEIPQHKLFHITDLSQALIRQNRRVGVFPVSQDSWTDMGNWDEFLRQAKVH